MVFAVRRRLALACSVLAITVLMVTFRHFRDGGDAAVDPPRNMFDDEPRAAESKVAKVEFVSPFRELDPPTRRSAPVRADGRYIPDHRVVHLDLKGAPPKMAFIKNLMPLIKSAGATALLVEYEDMFPFWGILRNVSAKNSYTTREIQQIQTWAAKNDLMVIPLIQTFGHLEAMLKLEEFKDLREVPQFPQSLCPSRERGWDVIREMIDQIVQLHPNSKWLHIGCDEVYQLAQCSLCSERIVRANNDPHVTSYHDGKSLFLEHVFKVASYVRNQKRVIPIIWDDMLRTLPSHTLEASGIGKLVEPMVWVYIEDIDRFIDSLTWSNYAHVFEYAWTASAYKGAFGERLYIPNMYRHVGNHLSWLEVMKRESMGGSSNTDSNKVLKFRGITLTGWSRYDHFAVLCELLPVAIPSLVLNLLVLTAGGHDLEVTKKANRLLQCNAQKSLMTQEELHRNPLQWDLYRCKFPGATLYSLMNSYSMNRKEVETLADRINNKDGWMSDYNVRHRFSSPWRVYETTKSFAHLPGAVRSMEAQLRKTLGQFFDRHTVNEWIEQHVLPLQETLNKLDEKTRILSANNTWARRPLD